MQSLKSHKIVSCSFMHFLERFSKIRVKKLKLVGNFLKIHGFDRKYLSKNSITVFVQQNFFVSWPKNEEISNKWSYSYFLLSE